MTVSATPEDPDARALLRILCWFSSSPIPTGLVSAAGDQRQSDSLVAAGALVPLPDGGFVLTPHARDLARQEFGQQGRLEAADALARFLGEPQSPGQIGRCLALIPHLTEWVKITASQGDTAGVGRLLNTVTLIALENSTGATAIPLAERLVRSATLHTGPRSANTLSARSNLAAAYAQAGEYSRSVKLLEQVVAHKSEEFGPGDEETWGTLLNLGYSCWKAGDHTRAIEIAEQIIDHRSKTLGPDDSATLMARHNLAVILSDTGQQAKARELWEELERRCAAALPPDDETAVAVRLFQRRSRRGASTSPADETDARHRLAEAEDHLSLLTHGGSPDLTSERASAMVDQATALRDLDRLDEAERTFREVIDGGGRALGTGHPQVVRALIRLGYLHTLRRPPRHEEAMTAMRQALARADASLGRTHKETAIAAVVLLTSLLAQGQDIEHAELLEDRLSDVIQALGFQHPLVRALAAHRARLRMLRPDAGKDEP
ncbi:tetratricopeptide repeat protein [Streptomyces flaveolus]|uniref:Tetratricopeptide repeat protein n=1 Tax=Streptomyces flaveolus TaxID=67297 RepID=A0ABV1VD42_9ACTN